MSTQRCLSTSSPRPASMSTPISAAIIFTVRSEWPRCLCFFFFQAEDGIRDWSVTGVQTCALPIFLYRAVDPEHEDVVAHDLWIVGCEISVGDAFEFILRYALVRFHRQMTAETARCPRCVTDLAIHRRVVVREFDAPFFRRGWHNTVPSSAVASQRFRVSRLRIVVRREWINRVDRLRNLPAHIRRHARLLKKFASFPDEPRTERCVAGVGQIDLSGLAACDQRWALIDR